VSAGREEVGTESVETLGALERYVARGIPAVGVAIPAATFEIVTEAGRVASELTRATANAETRPSFSSR
jgi:hypothetical protein